MPAGEGVSGGIGLDSKALILMVAACLALAGCMDGGDDDEDGQDPGPQDPGDDGGAGPDAPTVELTVRTDGNYPLDPGFDPDALEVGTGANVTVLFHNDDQLAPHAWRLEGVDGAGTGNVDPGESGQVTFTAPEPGEYVYYCPVGNHRQLGQEGVLTVTG